jgi:metal-responsive CopG/Arc/MetJ family transcriptional regulator
MLIIIAISINIAGGGIMKTIQMTLDDELVATVDQVVRELKTTRSAFTRKALRNAVKQVNVIQLEKKHKKGYGQHPADKTEFSVWESEQEWGDL